MTGGDDDDDLIIGLISTAEWYYLNHIMLLHHCKNMR
jgi:hypothetical protein